MGTARRHSECVLSRGSGERHDHGLAGDWQEIGRSSGRTLRGRRRWPGRRRVHAGMNWRSDSGMGVMGSSPNGSRNMRKSRKKQPKGMPRYRKRR